MPSAPCYRGALQQHEGLSRGQPAADSPESPDWAEPTVRNISTSWLLGARNGIVAICANLLPVSALGPCTHTDGKNHITLHDAEKLNNVKVQLNGDVRKMRNSVWRVYWRLSFCGEPAARFVWAAFLVEQGERAVSTRFKHFFPVAIRTCINSSMACYHCCNLRQFIIPLAHAFKTATTPHPWNYQKAQPCAQRRYPTCV